MASRVKAENARLREAGVVARDMIARWLFEEDDSGDDNDLDYAYDALMGILGPTTEESLAATMAARAARAAFAPTEPEAER